MTPPSQDRSARVAGQMEQLIEAYLAIGSLPLRENLKSFPNVPADVVRRTRGLDMVPVPTATVPVDPSGTYAPESLPIFTGFDREVQFVGGVNSPKRVKVSCSDGTRRAQLVKSGGDDLRQDAVMQQMFGLINALLAADGRCRQRALSVRTYRVVPLTPRCGLVEWVNNTLVLTDWLVGRSGGAHARYAPPGGLAYIEGVQKLRDAQVLEQQKGLGHLPAAWADVTSRFPPVLRHFFLERFPAPRDWYVARLTFTRSTAAASVAGYLLGLGDRHSSNILVDMSTAEVVHIDLGIAFEQGRLLPTPERVPFRMTRDIVDGMGPQGVEGPLRRCMEATVGVLRANRDPMLTVIEVFVHDPLYKWALSPSRARRWQQREEQPDAADAEEAAAVAPEALQGTADAARAILRVRQKLEGQGERWQCGTRVCRCSFDCCCGEGPEHEAAQDRASCVVRRFWGRGDAGRGGAGAAAADRGHQPRQPDAHVCGVGGHTLSDAFEHRSSLRHLWQGYTHLRVSYMHLMCAMGTLSLNGIDFLESLAANCCGGLALVTVEPS